MYLLVVGLHVFVVTLHCFVVLFVPLKTFIIFLLSLHIMHLASIQFMSIFSCFYAFVVAQQASLVSPGIACFSL